MRLLGYVLNEHTWLQLWRCSSCGKEHYAFGCALDFEFANAYGESHDPDLILEAPCNECCTIAEAIAGPELMKSLTDDGDTDFYEESVREIVLMRNGARLVLDA